MDLFVSMPADVHPARTLQDAAGDSGTREGSVGSMGAVPQRARPASGTGHFASPWGWVFLCHAPLQPGALGLTPSGAGE